MLFRLFSNCRTKFSVRSFALITESMKNESIVPDVIDCPPEERAEVVFDKKYNVRDGNLLTPKQSRNPPMVKWTVPCNYFYTVCMVDPDSPSREHPQCREMQHWLVVNIPGGKVNYGESLFAYIGPIPAKETGYHRYVILVYKQLRKLYFDEPRINKRNAIPRTNFSMRNFADKYKLGEPIAGNFFKAQYDESVPITCNQLCCR